MLSKIDVEDLQGNTLTLPIFSDDDTDYTIAEIEGLDPVKATIVSSTFAQMDGEQYQSSRREKRNIKLKIRIEPYHGYSTVSDLRAALYSYFMPKNWVNIKFYTAGTTEYTQSIVGMVESAETSIFSKDPEIIISILCFDSNFIGPSDISIGGNTVADTTEQEIVVEGSVETGYIFTLNVNRSISGFILYNRRPDGKTATIEVDYALITGDVLKISTVPNDKYVRLTRSGVTESVLYSADISSKFGPLYPGSNFIRVAVAGAAIPYSIVYRPKFGGL